MTAPVIPVEKTDACQNCRRPIHWMDGVGWLHGELPQYAGEPITCTIPHPVSCPHRSSPCPNGWTP